MTIDNQGKRILTEEKFCQVLFEKADGSNASKPELCRGYQLNDLLCRSVDEVRLKTSDKPLEYPYICDPADQAAHCDYYNSLDAGNVISSYPCKCTYYADN